MIGALILAAGLAVLTLVGGSDPATAHSSGTTGYAAVTVTGQSVRYDLSLPSDVLAPATGTADAPLAVDRLAAAVAGHVGIVADGRACEAVPEPTAPPAAGSATLRISVLFACASTDAALRIRDDTSDLFGPAHHTIAVVEWSGGRTQLVLESDRREGTVTLSAPEQTATPAAGTAAGPFATYLELGVEHILLGFDHVLFVVALVLQGGRMLRILGIVTAFTAAHSVTLALSVLEVVALPAAVVEPVIALSIAYVAAENVFLQDRAASRRWWVSFAFGLVHGCGFAGALREVGLPPDDLAVTLVGFNLGVEAGQALIVAAVVPALWWSGRFAWRRQAVRLASAAIMLGGVALLVERTLLGA